MNINLTLIASGMVFAAFLYVTMRFIWPPLMNAIVARQKKIAEGIAAAERGQGQLRDAETEANQILRDARIEATDIIGQGEKQASAIVNDAKDRAKVEGDKIIEQARETTQIEIQQAKSELKNEIATLAVSTASQILSKEVSAENHDQLLQKISEGFYANDGEIKG